jgi:hypothetical protein
MNPCIARTACGHLRCALSCLPALLLAPAAWGVPDPGVPCTWHVQLAYHYRDSGPQGRHETQLALATDTPLRCAGSGATTVLTPDGATQARGSAHVTGDSPHAGGPPGTRDIVDKRAHWPAPGAPADRLPAIEAPAPSFVGTGFGTKVTIAGALAGEELIGIAPRDGPAVEPAGAGTGRGPYTVLDAAPATDRLDIALYFDPAPGTPSDPNGALAQVPQRTREALAVLGGEAALALKGHLFGAQTTYTPEGNFSICYRRSLALAPAALDIDYCGWLTRAGQDWTPAHLPALEEPPAR